MCPYFIISAVALSRGKARVITGWELKVLRCLARPAALAVTEFTFPNGNDSVTSARARDTTKKIQVGPP